MKIAQADIFVEIVDYLGDMGWVVEFLEMSGLDLTFRIITNNPEKMGSFLEKCEVKDHIYEIIDILEYNFAESSKLVILGLHTKVDLRSFPLGRAIIRVSYLTFDPWYSQSHGIEHILSTPLRPIRELIYSPLPDTGGVWHYPALKYTREEWGEKMNLPNDIIHKIWIPIFCYEETLTNLDLGIIPENVFLFFIGHSPDIPSHYLTIGQTDHPTIPLSHHFPWLKREDFWALIDLSDISLLRGETSSLRGLMSPRPFLWDMYKNIGGWDREESERFLDFIEAGAGYRKLHNTINIGAIWSIQDILEVLEENPSGKKRETPDFRETLEKTLDSFAFSL